MKKISDWLLMNVALPLVIILLKVLSLTYSYTVSGGEKTTPYKGKEKNYIYAFWHCGLIAPVLYYKNLGIVALVSNSKDGEIAARIAHSFGFKLARGSTFKGAAKGLNEVKTLIENGCDAAITVDGPRGPAEKVANGVVYLAKLTGREIIPFGFNWGSKIRLTSWDRFMIPIPFSKGLFKFGAPVSVPADAGAEIIEKRRLLVETELKRLNMECEAEIGSK